MNGSDPRPPAGPPSDRTSPPSATPSLHDYGIIGNETTGALVSRHGSVDWACMPRFDSPSVFARLLDLRVGGSFRVAPHEPYESHQRYAPGTNVLTTFFELRRGVSLAVTDFMPMGPSSTALGGEARIIRRLLAKGAPIEVTVEADPRLDYARIAPSWSIDGPRAVASADAARLDFAGPWPWTVGDSGARATGTLVPGSAEFLDVRWGGPPAASPNPAELLRITDGYWRGWVSPPDAPLRRVAARWEPWVERSELVLKLLSYADTGVFVAAPTTSLPESPGGSRNWDYRYVWIRDAAFTAQVFLLLGHVREARGYVQWAFDRAARLHDGEELRTVYALDGEPPPAEAELPHLSGYGGARPVRIGNAAAGQRQLDIYGEILDSALLLERVDPAFIRDRWATIERLADRVTALWMQPDSGMWESRATPAHYVHSKLMCWVALDRATQLATALGRTDPIERWTRAAEEIHRTILARGWDAERRTFVQRFGDPALDASALRIGLDGLLPPSDPRVVSTIDAVEKTLGHGELVRRYEGDDGLGSPEGAFLLCSFWLVEALARSGQHERALTHWRGLLEAASPLLLFAEECDVRTRVPLGNFPQAFTHIGLLRAALALGLLSPES